MPPVTFTKDSFKRLKKAYDDCAGETFVFDGNVYLKSYAKYLIEYLDMQFNPKTQNENTGE